MALNPLDPIPEPITDFQPDTEFLRDFIARNSNFNRDGRIPGAAVNQVRGPANGRFEFNPVFGGPELRGPQRLTEPLDPNRRLRFD